MLQELKPNEFSTARSLFQGFDYSLSIHAAIEGNNPGRIFVDDAIDVGIITHPAHRRRGLAAVAVATTVEHCLSHGFSTVGWHCNADNVGSWKTAEKVGFERNREYAYYYYILITIPFNKGRGLSFSSEHLRLRNLSSAPPKPVRKSPSRWRNQSLIGIRLPMCGKSYTAANPTSGTHPKNTLMVSSKF